MKAALKIFGFALLVSSLILSSDSAFGQTTPGDGTQDPGNGAIDQGEQGGSNITGNDGQVSDARNVEIDVSDDVRNQGFVGATAQSIVNGRTSENPNALERNSGYIGVASDNAGPPLTDGANFGGDGTNDAGGGFSGNAAGGRGGNTGFGGTQNGVNITRRGLRAKLRPSFYSQPVAPEVVVDRFNNRLIRQPGSQYLGQSYSIRIENRTAYLTGSVPNNRESERLIRQLRLEPGVYKIVNQLRLAR